MLNVETLSEGSVTQQVNGRLLVETEGQGFVEITEAVSRWVFGTGVLNGLLTVFCRHTSASLVIQENADPDVRRDLLTAFERLAPREAGYVHDTEGPDDMPAHARSMLTASASCGSPGVPTTSSMYGRTSPHLARHAG